MGLYILHVYKDAATARAANVSLRDDKPQPNYPGDGLEADAFDRIAHPLTPPSFTDTTMWLRGGVTIPIRANNLNIPECFLIAGARVGNVTMVAQADALGRTKTESPSCTPLQGWAQRVLAVLKTLVAAAGVMTPAAPRTPIK